MKRTIILTAALLVFALISVRGWEHTVTALPQIEAKCPEGTDAILVIGQSHASNTGPKRHISWSRSYSFDGGACYYLRDPMPGTAGEGGSIWPKFAEFLRKPVVISNLAISGSAISQWTADTQRAKIRQAITDLDRSGFPDPLIIWMQGETDAAKSTDTTTYHAELTKLFATAPKHRWLIMRESVCYGKQTKWKPLDEARDQLAAENPNVTIGPDLDLLPLPLRQRDKCHLTAEGQEVLARQIAAAAAPILR
ncbi:MAG TPA: sialate O-acetylesterase [Sphingopyxis sp.]|jgi:hypothetical protein|uniref:sialate O-acetylesterase n=1 Tax=Sphingopyxis sp. TaxID=1908224 RepID=UPI002E15454C|nr:sialate O-acetylesterase [Sphingopyxis sp.]